MLAWHIFVSVICYSLCRWYWETVALNIVSRLICGWLVGTGLPGKVSVNCTSWMHFMKIRSYSSLPSSSSFFLRLGDFGGDIQNKVLSLRIKAYVQHSGCVQVRADNVHDIWIIQRVGALDATASPMSISFTLEIEKLVLKCTSQEQWNVSFGIEIRVECCI